jgi:two-component system response regulator GlrR
MLQKPTLLIVDDEANVLFTLKLVLEEDGYEITTANSCAEALKLIHNSHRFDAILTDLRMEQEDIGLELAEAAAKLRPRPVIMIFTGYGSVQNARGALGIQVDYFALKPLDLDDLKNALHRLLVGRGPARRGRA